MALADDDETILPPALPESPRPITPGVRRRAWREQHVRRALALLVVTAVAGVGLGVTQYVRWDRERRLIVEGVPVMGMMVNTDENVQVVEGHTVRSGAIIGMTYTLGGQSYRSNGPLEGYPSGLRFSKKADVPLRVDPKDPGRWTSRTEPVSLMQALLGTLLLTPLVVGVAVATWWKRRWALRVYRDGVPTPAEVVTTTPAVLSVGGRTVRYVTGEGGRVRSALLPAKAAAGLAAGDLIWLLVRPGESDGVPAVVFE